jgi:hypothetical protein
MSTHRLPRRRHPALLAASAVLALTVLAACGEDDNPTDTSGSIAAADTSPSVTPSPTPTATLDEADPPAAESSEPVPRTTGEEVDAADFLEVFETAVEQASSAKVSMSQSASGLNGKGIVDFASEPVAMQLTATLASMGEIEMRLVDNTMYMLLPMLGDKFVAFDLDDPNNPLGGSFADSVDPGEMLSAFADGIESATYAGEEDVDGEPMDHYTVVSDPSAALADLELPEGTPPIDLPETQTIDVWFDTDGFFRRVVTDLGELGTMTMAYDDWGTDVSIQAPPAGQITTMPGAPAA